MIVSQLANARRLNGVPMVGTLAAGETWALSGGGILVPTAIPAAANIQTLLDSIGSTRGMILRRGASAWEAPTVGTNGQVLTSNGTDPAWATPSSYAATAPVALAPAKYLSGNQDLTASAADIGNTLSLVNNTSKNMLVQGAYTVIGYAAGADSYGVTLTTVTNDGTTTITTDLAFLDVSVSDFKQIATLPFAVVIPANTTGSAKIRGNTTPAETDVTIVANYSYVVYSRSYF